ncbi:MAG: type II toxin-antitoxin system PemK/MazF family toxin [Ardenticatenaceae bacterium]|nr:type II toxin-antitoxin system PemK/MazF family toxin [Ardenticatenaceae bacterium]MCB9446509.1 type II toxin-antitoxin system PemK/MazF family toxin [Ardenticatenaceae bacterium]
MRRGEVWLINLDPTIGAEIRKIRPAVIVNDDAIGILPLKVIVPITDWKERYAVAPWMVKLEPSAANGLSKLSAADAFQVRSLSQERFVRRLGTLSPETMAAIGRALADVLHIESAD